MRRQYRIPRVEVFRIVPKLAQAIPIRIHRNEHRLHHSIAQLLRQLCSDGPYLHQLRWAYVGAVAEAEVEHHERSEKILVCDRPPVHIDKRERPAEQRFAGRFDLLSQSCQEGVARFDFASEGYQQFHRAPFLISRV